MQIPLKIVPSHSRHAAAAWLVFGATPQVWLAEIARWNVSLGSIVLRPMASGAVLVTIDDETGAARILPTMGAESASGVGPGCASKTSRALRIPATNFPPIPYRVLHSRLYIPVDAELFPPVDDADLGRLLPHESSAELVWHPTLGLIRCDAPDRLRVVDLLQLPPQVDSDWGRALPGTAFRSRLISVEPTVRPSAQEIMHAVGREIGNGSLDEIPPTPDEGLGGQIYQWTRPLRNAWKSLTKRPDPQKPDSPQSGAPGGNPSAGTGLGKLLSGLATPFAFAGGLIGRMLPQSVVDQAARLREIDRLMHLLKEDPDAGLKFALPMGGHAEHRGIAPATNQLIGRNTDFGLGNLFSSRPVDPWDIPPSQQFQLIQMYRNLAEREVRMGRHRRAAYIYAELLSDLQAAAGALENGHHYREAAALYRERLNRPADAARCLERGGLLDEAAELFVKLEMYENAADLYLRLERPDEAERVIRTWVTQLKRQGNHLRASEVLHQKLQDVDGALTVLDEGIATFSPHVESCHRQYFVVLGQHARHDMAAQRVQTLRQQAITRPQAPVIARVLSGVAARYGDAAVREGAFDATQSVVSRQLPVASPAEATSLLEAIRTLAPQDRLLSRDCDRFVRQQEITIPQKSRRQNRDSKLVLVREFKLARPGTRWNTAAASNEALFVAGFGLESLVVQRIPWVSVDFQHVGTAWGVSTETRVLLDVLNGSSQILIHAIGVADLPGRTLTIVRADPTKSHVENIGSPVFATQTLVAITRSAGGSATWRVRAIFGMLELSAFSPKGDEIFCTMCPIPFDEASLHDVRVSVSTMGRQARVAVGKIIFRPPMDSVAAANLMADPSQTIETVTQLDANILSLHSGLDSLVALTESGGVMIREPIQHNRVQSFAESMLSPVGSFLPVGAFAIADQRECHAYVFDGGVVKQLGQVALPSPAVAVTRTDKISEFAVVCEDATVRIFGIHG